MGRDRGSWGGIGRVGKGQREVGSDTNRCEEIARDGDGLGEVWRDRRGGKGQREVGRDRERWGGPAGRDGEDQGAIGRDRRRWEETVSNENGQRVVGGTWKGSKG